MIMKTDIYNLNGDVVGSVELNDATFHIPWNADLVHQALHAQLSNARQPLAHTKSRGDVRGGGKKPWRQKGTGRARHGSIRSPIWVGGGVSHGPRNEKDYSVKLNKKMLRKAIHSVLSKKVSDGELRIVDSLQVDSGKTKTLSKPLSVFPSVLLIAPKDERSAHRTTRNLTSAKAIPAQAINVRDLLRYHTILVDQKALQEIL
ncbi:MAG: 50S ribosomal protein L4 [Candidatus Harrisonbacteria bacterium CG10_big_fil_rev_8_21_14_0_10_42_17]|uniref:Large ribosomal subunit protein uL4 n=1 Tax=Candidatus Harrisonbacteria bacterium CG10_big_fil_rev_8_21_14_0_10_42_17 TaxID=1974584 RepID=A0A2M6WHL0_9BACT|nr:MAG: 50S ribosomal protein L4 [Candidatus Harrisonbacteria bacterium CG10_big_fil_rev_8_21_14_0_10_42_17]